VILSIMQGSLAVVSGVPGLGSSVKNHHNNSSLLTLWDGGGDKQRGDGGDDCGAGGDDCDAGIDGSLDKPSVRTRLRKLFSFRIRIKSDNPSCKYSTVQLPKVSVKRSSSVVSSLHRYRERLSQAALSEEKLHTSKTSDRTGDTTPISHSSSYHPQYMKYQSSHNQEQQCQERLPLSEDILHSCHELVCTHNGQECVGRCKRRNISKATQTETGELDAVSDDKEYDYVYSNFVSPAVAIHTEGEIEENMYEEIVPKNRKVRRSKSLIFPTRHRTRNQPEDNYMRPQDIKQNLFSLFHHHRRKESRNVRFDIE